MKHVLARSLMAFLLVALLLTSLTKSTAVLAAPGMRVQVDQHGDFVLFGNTFGEECASGTPAPVVGTVGTCGTNTNDSAPDIFWRSDSPADGQAEANTDITGAQARSTAMLVLPAGAQVTHAYLYWAALGSTPSADTAATLDRPGVGGFSQPISALSSLTAAGNRYQSVADVTALVQANGAGAYRVSDVDIVNLVNLNNSNAFGAWWMVVLYERDSDPLRNLTIYDGLDGVSNGSPQDITLSGFQVPNGLFDAKLGVVAMDGDNPTFGDTITFNGSTLSDGQNPATNFFNGTHSYLGAAVSVAGDLPQLTGTGQSMSGVDLDVVDVTPFLTAGQTSAPISATSTGDIYFLSTFVTSITTFRPNMATSTKTAVDLNGGALMPGDSLEYTMVITNTGNETATLTVLNDPLPAGVTYSPGSLEILSGANAGAKTDAASDDQAEYVAASRSVAVRLGDTADAAQGGALGLGESTTLRFRVTIDANCSGPTNIANQATISTTGEISGSQNDFVTDGNGAAAGNPPTTVTTNFRCLTVGTAGAGTGTVTSAPAGISCGADCGETLASGTVINLTANASASSTFAGWSGDASGTTNPLAVTLDANKAITATFTLNSYSLAPTAGSNGSISPNTPQTIDYGSNQAFTITSDAGYMVADVLVDGVSVGAVSSYTFTNVTAGHTIAATFTLIAPTSTPTSTPSATPTSTPSATPDGTPSATPDGTPSATPGGTPSATPTIPQAGYRLYVPVVIKP